jgi:hypothetical protein
VAAKSSLLLLLLLLLLLCCCFACCAGAARRGFMRRHVIAAQRKCVCVFWCCLPPGFWHGDVVCEACGDAPAWFAPPLVAVDVDAHGHEIDLATQDSSPKARANARARALRCAKCRLDSDVPVNGAYFWDDCKPQVAHPPAPLPLPLPAPLPATILTRAKLPETPMYEEAPPEPREAPVAAMLPPPAAAPLASPPASPRTLARRKAAADAAAAATVAAAAAAAAGAAAAAAGAAAQAFAAAAPKPVAAAPAPRAAVAPAAAGAVIAAAAVAPAASPTPPVAAVAAVAGAGAAVAVVAAAAVVPAAAPVPFMVRPHAPCASSLHTHARNAPHLTHALPCFPCPAQRRLFRPQFVERDDEFNAPFVAAAELPHFAHPPPPPAPLRSTIGFELADEPVPADSAAARAVNARNAARAAARAAALADDATIRTEYIEFGVEAVHASVRVHEEETYTRTTVSLVDGPAPGAAGAAGGAAGSRGAAAASRTVVAQAFAYEQTKSASLTSVRAPCGCCPRSSCVLLRSEECMHATGLAALTPPCALPPLPSQSRMYNPQ